MSASFQRFLSKYGFIKTADDDDDDDDDAQIRGVRLSLEIQERGTASRSGSPDLRFISALKDFQQVSGLPVTGVFDDATKAAMNKPRCGVPDQDEELESTEPMLNDTAESNSTTTHNHTDAANNTEPRVEKQRHLAALLSNRRKRDASEWKGHMAFSKSLLKWRLIGEGYSSQLSIDEQKYIFRLAFRMWSEVSPLEFVEDTRSPLEDIDIRLGFGTGQY